MAVAVALVKTLVERFIDSQTYDAPQPESRRGDACYLMANAAPGHARDRVPLGVLL